MGVRCVLAQLASFVRGISRVATGKVKWFNNAKGYGFVIAEAGGEDLFAHYTSIQMDGYKTLKAGQDVEFDIEQGPKGLHAVNIRAFEAEATESVSEHPPCNDETRATKAPFGSPSRGEYAQSH